MSATGTAAAAAGSGAACLLPLLSSLCLFGHQVLQRNHWRGGELGGVPGREGGEKREEEGEGGKGRERGVVDLKRNYGRIC